MKDNHIKKENTPSSKLTSKSATKAFAKNRPLNIALSCIFWILLWWGISLLVGKSYIVPSPLETLRALGAMAVTGNYWMSVLMTLLRVLGGMAASFILGFFTAILAYKVSFARAVFSQICAVFKATPVMSVIMFFILFLVSGTVPIVVCFLMCFPIFYTNILAGLDDIPSELIDAARDMSGSEIKKFRLAILPCASSGIKTAIELGCGLAWKTVVAAEVLASPKISMGSHLLLAKTYFEADELFAWTISIVILSVIFTKLIKILIVER